MDPKDTKSRNLYLSNFELESEYRLCLDKATRVVSTRNSKITQHGERENVKEDSERYEILCDVSLVLESGKSYLILGETGCGKSSLLTILSGLEAPCSGSAMSTRIEGDCQFMCLLQQQNYYSTILTVSEYLFYHTMIARPSFNPSTLKSQIDEQLRFWKVKHLEHRNINNEISNNATTSLSGGERILIDCIKALLIHPKLILADEVTSGLDFIRADKIIKILTDYPNENPNSTTVTIGHQLTEEQRRSFSSIILMSKGKVVYNGPSSDLLNWYDGPDYVFKTEPSVEELLRALCFKNMLKNKTFNEKQLDEVMNSMSTKYMSTIGDDITAIRSNYGMLTIRNELAQQRDRQESSLDWWTFHMRQVIYMTNIKLLDYWRDNCKVKGLIVWLIPLIISSLLYGAKMDGGTVLYWIVVSSLIVTTYIQSCLIAGLRCQSQNVKFATDYFRTNRGSVLVFTMLCTFESLFILLTDLAAILFAQCFILKIVTSTTVLYKLLYYLVMSGLISLMLGAATAAILHKDDIVMLVLPVLAFLVLMSSGIVVPISVLQGAVGSIVQYSYILSANNIIQSVLFQEIKDLPESTDKMDSYAYAIDAVYSLFETKPTVASEILWTFLLITIVAGPLFLFLRLKYNLYALSD